MIRRIAAGLTVLAIGVALLVVAAPWREGAGSDGSAGTLGDLRSVEELQQRFNGDAGMARVILLLSPT